MTGERVRAVPPGAQSRKQNVLLACCVGLAVLFAVRIAANPDTVESGYSIEADMFLSHGHTVELYLNDWTTQPPERLPVMAGERHVYRFTHVRRDIRLVRLDPTDVRDAQMVIYGLTVKTGNRVFRRFTPAELMTWTLHDVSIPAITNGGMAMHDTTDDPILWTNLRMDLPANEAAEWWSFLRRWGIPLAAALATTLMTLMALRGQQHFAPFVLEWPLTMVSAGLAVWILITTIYVSCIGWVAIPVADDWDRWRTLVIEHYTPHWFFLEHVDHRLVVPKLLFTIDDLAFHARGWFLLLCAFCCQAVTGFLLWRLAINQTRQSPLDRWSLAAATAACVFSAQQWVNFVWPFQVQFPMVYCWAAAALFAIWKGAGENWRPRWIAAGIGFATLATYSMANGILVWPLMLAAALWFGMPRRWAGMIAAGAAIVGVAYFYHWHPSSEPGDKLPLLVRIPRALIFWMSHLGSPMFPLLKERHEAVQLIGAAIPGALLALALLGGLVMVWRRRGYFSSASLVLILYALFLAGTSATMALARSGTSLLDLFSPRYLTPAYLLWLTMLFLAWPLLRSVPRFALYGAICLAILAGVAVHQTSITTVVRDREYRARLAEVAIADNVSDPDAWLAVYHTPQITMPAVDYLKRNRLTVFNEDWSRWPGIPLHGRFSIDRAAGACQGNVEQTTAVAATFKPGWRLTGWAWDVKAARPPQYLVLADDSGQVAGVALTGFPALPDQHHESSWNGYVNGSQRSITVYAVEGDNRSLCPIGTQQLPALK